MTKHQIQSQGCPNHFQLLRLRFYDTNVTIGEIANASRYTTKTDDKIVCKNMHITCIKEVNCTHMYATILMTVHLKNKLNRKPYHISTDLRLNRHGYHSDEVKRVPKQVRDSSTWYTVQRFICGQVFNECHTGACICMRFNRQIFSMKHSPQKLYL